MKYQFFSTSEKAWDAMLSAIVGAQKSSYLEMYILGNDKAGKNFFQALESTAAKGVKIILILDIVGSFSFNQSFVDNLRKAGIEVLFASFLFKRMHRKILVVDEKIAFIGGVNIGKNYAGWKDLQVRVTGSHLIQSVLRSFARMYQKCGGTDAAVSLAKPHGVLKRTKLWFVDHGIGKHNKLLRKYYEERLRQAEKSIILVTPYLLPPRWLIAHLHQALIRKVEIEILLPVATDYRIINTINRSYAAFLENLGAKIYFSKGMNHAKVMIVDKREAIIGSQNLDFLSFHMNIEAGIFFHEPDMIHDLLQVIEEWKKDATSGTAESAKFHWYDIPTAFFLRLFGFIPLW